MSYWNELRASGVDLTKRYCIECKTKKSTSLFPKHQRYRKSRVCFECLGEIKCRTCEETKPFEEFKSKHSGSRKSKIECWECFKKRKKERDKKYKDRKRKAGTLPKNSDLPLFSQYWSKISNKRTQGKNSQRSSEVLISSEEFKKWFEKNHTGKCYYCDISVDKHRASNFLKRIRPHIRNFGVDRKDTTKGYSVDNIVIACNLCNSVKGAFFTDSEFKIIGPKYIRKLYDN